MMRQFVVFAFGRKALFNVPSARLICFPENNRGFNVSWRQFYFGGFSGVILDAIEKNFYN